MLASSCGSVPARWAWSEAAVCSTPVVCTVVAPAGAADMTNAAATPKSGGAATIGSRFFACFPRAPKGLLPELYASTGRTAQRANRLHVLLHDPRNA